ncbi:hypothetical protein FGO68_gene15111 [Halteria grandinella]|uniref:Uncharacterized protein n=1 Tax=Halteria grandinella TaxID=5974 RepID=A0A8J8SUY7_HALGN|nr:hypothetical protein FGO68_gene15111 [Halteria grandinella]
MMGFMQQEKFTPGFDIHISINRMRSAVQQLFLSQGADSLNHTDSGNFQLFHNFLKILFYPFRKTRIQIGIISFKKRFITLKHQFDSVLKYFLVSSQVTDVLQN